MIFKLKNLHKFFFTYICPTFYGSTPPPAPTNTTQTQNINSIPGELMPFALGNLQAAKKQLFTTDSKGKITGYQPYTPYSTDANKYVAGFSGLQTQAQQGAANLQVPGQFAPASGIAGMSSLGALNAGNQFAQQATDPNATAAYMSPYMQDVVDYQTQQANRQYDITGAQQMGNATRAGAFGGSREAIMAAENERNRNLNITGIQKEGRQSAFQNAQAQQQFGANLGLQGYQAGIQGAQALGQLGTEQLAAETGVLATQSQYGAEQQGREQALINQNIKNWENQQNQPYRAMDVMSGLIRGMPINASSTTATTTTANPSYAQQVGGLLGTAGSLYGAYKGKANGGIVQAYASGGVTETVENSIEAKLRDMSPEQLQAYIPTITSQEELSIAKMILAEETPQMAANGGIMGYAVGGQLGWKEQLESAQQEMKAKDYRAYGWTDEDIANYKSSGRVPLDPKKQLALREAEPSVKMPEDKGAYYEELQAKARRAPESEVIRLRDENAQRTSGKPKGSSGIGADKGISGYRPPVEEAVSPKFGGNLESPAVEGEYLGREVPSFEERARLSGQPIKDVEGQGYTTRQAEEAKRAYAERAGKAPLNAGQAREELLNKARANESFAPKEGVAGPSPEIPKTATGKGLSAVKGLAPAALKTLGALSLPDLVDAMTGQPEDSKTFKEYENIKKKKGMKGVLAHMNAEVAAGNERVAKGVSTFASNASEKIGKPLSEWWSGEEGQQPEPTGIASAAPQEATPPVASTANLPGSIVEGMPNKINLADSAASTGIKGATQEGQVYPQAVARSFDQQGLTLPVQSTAYQPSEEPAVAPQAADDGLAEERATSAKTPSQIMAEREAEREKAGLRSADQISAEQRKSIMDEKSNIADESKRQMYLRMAEFFSNWGSTPGLPLVAGLKAMKDTIPGVMSDSKADHAAYAAVNKSLRDLEHATELEKAGRFDKAYEVKEQASANILKHKDKLAQWGHDKEMLAIEQQGATERAQLASDTSIAGHKISAKATQARIKNPNILTEYQKSQIERAADKYAQDRIDNDTNLLNAPKEEKDRLLKMYREEAISRYNPQSKSQPTVQPATGFTPAEEALYQQEKSKYMPKNILVGGNNG